MRAPFEADQIDEAVTSFDFYLIVNGLRAAVDLGVSAYSLVAQGNGTVSNNQLSFSKETVLTTWMSIEYVFAFLVFSHLFTRNCRLTTTVDAQQLEHDEIDRCGCISCIGKNTYRTQSGRNVLLLRFTMGLLAMVAGSLLASDLEGETGRSIVGVTFIILSTFLSNALIEKYKAVQNTQAVSLFNRRAGIPDGYELNENYVLTPRDMYLAVNATALKYSGFSGTNIYRLARNNFDNEILLVTPPITTPDNNPPRFSNNVGTGITTFVNKNTSRVPRDIFDEIRVEIAAPQDQIYRILFPCQGLDGANQDLWCNVEIVIEQLHGAAGNTYSIKMFAHNPQGNGEIPPNIYKILGYSIKMRLVEIITAANAPNIHFPNHTAGSADIDVDNIPVVVNPADIPKSSYANPRLAAGNHQFSGIVALDDINKRLNGTGLKTQQFSSIELADTRRKIIEDILFYHSKEQTQELRSRAFIQPPQNNPAYRR